jgi:photosystem II stability/assembly factor-like uncharacterized protein
MRWVFQELREVAMIKSMSLALLSFVVFSYAILSADGVGAVSQEPCAKGGAQKAIGWAVGEPVDGYGTILHTADGGRNWERQGTSVDIPDVGLVGVSAVSARQAWAVGGADSENGYGVILHTKDGGESWTREGPGSDLKDVGLTAVSAVNKNIAWTVGSAGNEGVILRTKNGGALWERQGIGQVPNVALNGVYASDASHVWVVGDNEPGNDYGTILRTTDGGATWEKVPYELSRTFSSAYLITVDGANAHKVWAVGRGQIVRISVTSQGISVTDQTPDFSSMYDINGVYALNRLTIWAVADLSNIWRSRNGGKTWTSQPAPLGGQYVLRVSAINKRHAWATTSDQFGSGYLWNTSDGGRTWAPQQIPVATGMWGISFVRKQGSACQ